MRPVLVALLCLAGCGIGVVGSGGDVTPVGSAPSDAGADGAIATGDASPIDGTDAAIDAPLDAPASVVPSHVSAVIDPAAADLSGVTAIDTSARTVTTGAGSATVRFESVSGAAVLYVGAWNVDVGLRVTGTAPLVVLASKAVTINATIDAAARLETAGPGGSGPVAGPGKGTSGSEFGTDSAGGGGAGFGTAGAKGGDSQGGATGAAAGAAYGPLFSDFLGGSGGGKGSPFGNCGTQGNGGAGGGALQITSAVAITIASGGVIDVGGGGGRGGCLGGSTATMSGGGGGSGGTIVLEAPVVTVSGTLASNGGGGGGGAYNGIAAGQDGANGDLTTAPATGGTGGVADQKGGSGGAGTTAPAQPGAATGNAGGGGGAVGRIWLRTRGGSPTLAGGAVVTPAPGLDSTL